MANSGNPVLDEIDGLSPGAKLALGIALPRPPAPTVANGGAPAAVSSQPSAISAQPAAPRPIATPMPKPPALGVPANSTSTLPAAMAPLPSASSFAAANPIDAKMGVDRADLARITKPAIPGVHDKTQTGLSGIGQIHAKKFRIPLEIADAFGSTFFPKFMLNIPGTELHHNLLVRERENDLANDEAQKAQQEKNELTEGQTAEAGARKGLLEEQIENLEHPPGQAIPTSEGYFSFNPRTGAVAPIAGPNGEPLQPFIKPGNRQHVVLKGPDGKPMLGFVDPVSGLTTDAEGHPIEHPVPFEKPSSPQHITVMGKDGKPHVMGANAQGNFTRDLGEAPPNYAEVVMPTKTTELLGSDGVMHRFQYNPKTNAYDIDMGPAPTGTAQHQIFQASAIERLAPEVVADINANRDILGNLSSYYKQWLTGTPVGDPKAAQLMTELMSLAAMQPALHAFRSHSALDAFEKMIGGLAKNPDATIASIEGLMKTPEAFTNLAHGNKSGAPESQEPVIEVDGKRYRYKGSGASNDLSNYTEVGK